jgi:signal transduction histidine kinase
VPASRDRRWRPSGTDVAIAAGTALLGLLSAAGIDQLGGHPPSPKELAWLAGLLAVLGGTLLWRHRAPVAVYLALAAVRSALITVSDGSILPPPVDWVALFTVARRRRLALTVPLLVLDAVLGTASLLIATSDGPLDHRDVLAGASAYLLLFAPAWVLGAALRQRDLALRRRDERQRASARRWRQDALASERARIARELHDVATASLGHMGLRAGAAHARFDEHPDDAREALSFVQATGRETLAAMRRLLGMLRAEGERGQVLAPQPTLARVPDLAAAARAQGLPVTLEMRGARRRLPDDVELAAYRVVQEAVVRAGSGGAAIMVTYGDHDLCVQVREAAGADQRAALAEWVRLFGGTVTLSTGEEHDVLTARFPVEAPGGAASRDERGGWPVEARSAPEREGAV